MKKIESIYNSDKFEKTELRKIKGGLKATVTNRSTNAPRRINGDNTFISTLDADEDE